jgi:hypothetical protein
MRYEDHGAFKILEGGGPLFARFLRRVGTKNAGTVGSCGLTHTRKNATAGNN